MIHNTRISIVVAVGENREIGKKDKLLWDIPEDRKRFRDLTKGHAVIWGRKTFESVVGYIGKAPSGRTNIIITRDKNYKYDGCIVAHSLEESLRLAREQEREEIFIGGGGEIYKQVFNRIDRLYVSIVRGEYEADAFFPDYQEFKKVLTREERESGGYRYVWLTLER